MMNIAVNDDIEQLAGLRIMAEHSNKELLRFITCGSVDDGKSTLIGRLLLETGAVYDDQIATLEKDSKKHGSAGLAIDPALLLDGLEDERQQGITIDVAYRYFTTSKRKFIIADTPGHEQFTRNMVTAASSAELALILVDASKGVLTQTRRHTFIASLLGIKHVIVAVNKMDLVDYEQTVFESICKEFREFASQLAIPDIRFVPLSALLGDNVIKQSSNISWYDSGSLLSLLENVPVSNERSSNALRFPVQWVNRPDSSFRGFSGTIESGSLKVGDAVVVLPSRKSSYISRIVTRDGELEKAKAKQSVTLTLSEEIDVTRGDMIVEPENLPHIVREADAMLVWLVEQPLVSGKSYWIKHTTRRTSGEVQQVLYSIDVNTLRRSPSANLKLNEIGCCRILLHDPVMLDAYQENRSTGAFIMVDRITHETVAAGMFLDRSSNSTTQDHWDDRPTGLRLERVKSRINKEDREHIYGQRPFTLLITGLSASGKTTLAVELERLLFEAGKKCVLLDGQDMRFGISRDLGFSAEERSENLRRAAEIAKTINDAGLICIAAFVAPHNQTRKRAQAVIGADRFVHVHLTTPLAVCRQRDETGRYDAADQGELVSFPGVTFSYEIPKDADLHITTEGMSSEMVARKVLVLLALRFGSTLWKNTNECE